LVPLSPVSFQLANPPTLCDGAAMKRALISVFLLFGLSALAQDLVITQFQLPTWDYFYNTNMTGGTGNTVVASVKHLGGKTMNGGQPATNAIPVTNTHGATNTAMWIAPIDLSFYDNGSILFTETTLSNVWTTNWLFLYPCPDGCNPDTNNFVTLGPFTNNVFGTNLLCFTNLTIPGYMGPGGPRYWQLGWGVQGTNSITNAYAQVFVIRPMRTAEAP
jgi:hypothetical protein